MPVIRAFVAVKPTDVILTYNGQQVNESTKLEERNEGDEVVLTCKAPGGKPIPTVSWYKGSQLMNLGKFCICILRCTGGVRVRVMRNFAILKVRVHSSGVLTNQREFGPEICS